MGTLFVENIIGFLAFFISIVITSASLILFVAGIKNGNFVMAMFGFMTTCINIFVTVCVFKAVTHRG